MGHEWHEFNIQNFGKSICYQIRTHIAKLKRAKIISNLCDGGGGGDDDDGGTQTIVLILTTKENEA